MCKKNSPQKGKCSMGCVKRNSTQKGKCSMGCVKRNSACKNEGSMWCVRETPLDENEGVCFRSVPGCVGMDVWVNVFTMPFLCADSGPWRRMSRAWPPMSAITTSSGSTCPGHQESAWGAAEARQERVMWRLLEKALLSGNAWVCVEHICKCVLVSTVLGEKASDVEQSWRASAKLPGRRPPPLWTGRGQLNEGVTFSELTGLLFVFGVCMGGRECMCEWMFVFTMSFLCADSRPWRTMSRAWPPMSAITTSSGSTCQTHRVSAWWAAGLRQERVIVVVVVIKGIVAGRCCWTHLQMFLSVLS